jgi:hypothetical protein
VGESCECEGVGDSGAGSGAVVRGARCAMRGRVTGEGVRAGVRVCARSGLGAGGGKMWSGAQCGPGRRGWEQGP